MKLRLWDSRNELYGNGGKGIFNGSELNGLVHLLLPQVREATNNEPWGCSTSMMQEIASGTYN